MSAASSPTLRPSITIDLSAIARNYDAIQNYAPSAETAAVLKADAYGHGAPQIARTLLKKGCASFFVAYPHEGAELRKIVGNDAKIYVFNGIQASEQGFFHEHKLIPVCNSIEQLRVCVEAGSQWPYALHIDTGMNRLGIASESVHEVSALCKSNAPALVLSHLACADEIAHELNKKQLSAFQMVCRLFTDSRHSLSATAGVWLGPEYHFDLIRPGIGLYGGGPATPMGVSLEAAMTVTAPLLQVRRVPKGASVGYGASYEVMSDAVIATASLGYADGFLRSGSNYGFGIINDTPCPIVGRISMDLITLDVSDCPNIPEIGDDVEFLGRKAGLEIQAQALGTLGYELTCRAGGRMSRSWIE